MIEFLFETPGWVYAFFFYLLFVGYKGSKARTLPFNQLVILPTLFMGWGLWSLSESIEGQSQFALFWAAALFAGSLIGFLQVHHWHFHVNKERQTITLPPSWSTLFLSMTFFGLKYSLNYAYSTNPNALHQLLTLDVTVSGFIVGMFLGRFWRFRKAYVHGT